MSVLRITKENFEQEVLHSTKPVLLDFWAAWCGPCQMAAPILKQVAEDTEDTAVVGKVNVQEEPELMEKFGVINIPTFIVLKNGEVTEKAVGVQDKDTLLNMLQL